MSGFKITTIHAVVTVDEHGDEGVPAWLRGGVWFPLVAADDKRLEDVLAMARVITAATGQKLKLVRFEGRVDVEDIE